ADTQSCRDAGSEIAPLRGSAEYRRAVTAGFDSFSRGCRRNFRIVVGECRILDNDDRVGAVLCDLRRLGADSRRAKKKRVNLRGKFVGELSRGGNRLQANLSHIATASFDVSEDVGHYRTLASVCSSFTSSGTALAPSPTTLPALRSAGSSSLRTVSCGGGS